MGNRRTCLAVEFTFKLVRDFFCSLNDTIIVLLMIVRLEFKILPGQLVKFLKFLTQPLKPP